MPEQDQSSRGLTRLDPRQKSVMRIRALLFGLLPLAAMSIADFAANAELGFPYGPVTGVAVLVYLTAALVLPARRFRRWGYRIGADAILIARGLLFRIETVVPFARVQHIDVSRGPLERGHGVATLILHTAGSYNSTVALPGLALDDANRIRELIRSHIREDLP